MKHVLIAKFKADPSVGVACGGGTVRAGQVAKCSALAGAGRGYRVEVKLPCWVASFDGTLIEGPGLTPPKKGARPIAPAPARPTNLPDTFSGCVT